MKQIEWAPIKGYEDSYEISSLGQVRSLNFAQTGKTGLLSPGRGSWGYYTVSLKHRSRAIHRLVAEHFISNPSNLPQVNHKNGVRSDNRLENLEWVTASQNVKHSYDYLDRRRPDPRTLGKRFLTKNQVLEIRYGNFGMTQMEMADHYSVHQATISLILAGKIWKWL